MKMFAEHEAEKMLRDKLDESLLNHAKDLSAGDGPKIVDVYNLQGLAEVHCYLKTVHQFDSAEVEALLQFADPLAAAHLAGRKIPMSTAFPFVTCCGRRGQRSVCPLQSRSRPKDSPCGSSYAPL